MDILNASVGIKIKRKPETSKLHHIKFHLTGYLKYRPTISCVAFLYTQGGASGFCFGEKYFSFIIWLSVEMAKEPDIFDDIIFAEER